MDYKKSYQISEITMAVFAATVVLALILDFLWWLLVPGFLAACVGAVLFLKYCRCPHCGHRFSAREKLPSFCSQCGKKLDT